MKEIKNFIEMMDRVLVVAKDGAAQPLYLQAIENLMASPQYQALKAAVDKPFVVTDEMVEKVSDVFYYNLGRQQNSFSSMKAALEAVFASYPVSVNDSEQEGK